jgi:Glycosyltransferase family 87
MTDAGSGSMPAGGGSRASASGSDSAAVLGSGSGSGSAAPRRLADLIVPVGSLLLMAGMFALVLGNAGANLGYDYRCYEGASRALLDGKPIYDVAFSINVGACPGTYTYPPPFAVALVPWLSLGGAAAGLWCVAMVLCFVAGAALMPVRRDVRWLIVVIAALDWPLLYAVKLGQVEPILFLVFAAAWRWMDRAAVVGSAAAIGALVKVQPGLLAVWAIATGRFRALAVSVAVGATLAAAATLVTGFGAWTAYVDLLRGLGGNFTTPHNFAPGAVAYLAGASETTATIVQWASVALAVAILLAGFRFGSAELSLMVTILVSQLLSAPLRDHYAVLLLLPAAFLVQRGRTWAVIFPLLGWISLFADGTTATWLPTASVSLTFFGCLAVLLWEVRRERETARPSLRPEAAPAAG